MSNSNLQKLTRELEAARWKKLEYERQLGEAKFTKYACYYTDHKAQSFDISPSQRYLRRFNTEYQSKYQHRLESVYDPSIAIEGDDFDELIPKFKELVNNSLTIEQILEHRRTNK